MAVVETTYGKLRGEQREAHLAFRGIRYAGPAGGSHRFRAPTPPEHFEGVRDATEWGTAARQTSHPIPGFAASGPQDEDCLFLNVFTPAADDRRRPVLFWIHGGGFTHGTAAEPLYDGGPLAVLGDVVVVSINYRLGAFGYLYLGEHLPGAGLAANAGQLDQVAALEWVRDNIAAFGGDAANVTIFGESAGAAAVGTLLAMPAARGLFHRAILQSGSGRAASPEEAARVTSMLLQELGLEKSDAAELLALPADALLGAQTAVVARARDFGLPLGPVRDAATLPRSPLEAIAAGEAANIPMLIGTNRDEVKLFSASMRRDPMDDATLVRAVTATLPRGEWRRCAEGHRCVPGFARGQELA
ncbi:MAG: carboxylesterase family protein [Dehalococcoidia bacterium]|nr:carboxylesterase family protein [Dehalococcoidia bacterium]